MSTNTTVDRNTTLDTNTTAASESRILTEAYGPGAWHGADLKAALADVTPAQAYWRPGVGRHNIAEIALHHAYCVRGVRAKISGQPAEPFLLDGDDWFTLDDERALSWQAVLDSVKAEHEQLNEQLNGQANERVSRAEPRDKRASLSPDERMNLVLGIAFHAIYHAGQIQLIKRLRGDS